MTPVAKDALVRYIRDGRPQLVKDENSIWLFTNCSGGCDEPSGILEADQVLWKAGRNRVRRSLRICRDILFFAHLVCAGQT